MNSNNNMDTFLGSGGMDLPLKGITVLEFCQYLSGPSASLRLADLGATVIKIERPIKGDAGRKLAIKDLWVDESSMLFHTVNRNKENLVADLKNDKDLNKIKSLITTADVLIHNFRPGVMEKTGLGFDDVKKINPTLIYASISGYGTEGKWKYKPGQDLLIQAITGLTFTTGNANNSPVPFGLAIGDMLCGAQLVQGIIAGLIRKQKTGVGALIEISLMESLLDFQFELLTTYFKTGQQPQRSKVNNGHSLLGAPYGIYKTADGYIALAMMDLHEMAVAIELYELKQFEVADSFKKRDEIKHILAKYLITQNSDYWIDKLHEKNLWAIEVFDWEKMVKHDAYKVLEMEQIVQANGNNFITTRCPIKIDGQLLVSAKPSPAM